MDKHSHRAVPHTAADSHADPSACPSACGSSRRSGPACACAAGARPAASQGNDHGHAHGHDHSHSHGEEGFSHITRLVIPGILFTVGLAGREWLTGHFGPAGFYIIMLFSYLLCGLPMLREAWRSILRRDYFNEFTLMGLATLVAMGIGEVAEAVGVMLFYSIGEAVQEKAAGSSRRSIQSLLASKPQSARVMAEGRVSEVRPETVAIGSMVLVKPGEKIPLDGEVVDGRANLDMSSLTGESVPVAVNPGDAVYSGAISLDGDIVLRTDAVYADSMVGRILSMVEHAVSSKSRTERFITTFSRYYTPAVAVLAALVAVLPPLLFSQPWEVWIYRGLVLLVVSCPCALFLSVPLAFFAGIGAASRQGMLVKGGQVFDALAKARSVVFDKTGTLTEGRLSLVGALPAPGVTEAQLLRLSAMAESRSNHPVARAVIAASGEADAFHGDVSLRDVAGKGIVATTPLGEILVGNAALLLDHGVDFTATERTELASYVALDGAYQGCLLFADGIKADSAEAVQRLRRENGVANLYMLTGDRPETAAAVADALGLDGYRAGLLPDEKVTAFRDLSPDGRAVFVGDGVNDAPVLAASGVGVAMGALGSAAAVEAADAVILDDSPSRLPALFRVAARTRRIAGENIAFALGIKTVVMILGVAGISGLWMADFADVGVALLAVANSLRLIRE